MAAPNFTFADALLLDEGLGHRLAVRVVLDDGKPSSVTFSELYAGQMVSVPFEIWARVVAAVERAVDLNEVSGS